MLRLAQLARQEWGIFGYFFSQRSSKVVQSIQGCLLIYGGIDRLQIDHKCLQVLVGHILLELRSWWMMQFWISVWGKMTRMAASNPVKLSVQAMKMSSTPRFFRSLSTVAQNLALSFSPTHMPRTSFRPSRLTPMAIYTALSTIYHGSGWHPKTQRCRWAPEAAAASLWQWAEDLVRDPADRAV